MCVLRKKKVLYVEDDYLLSMCTGLFLEKNGFNVIYAYTGEEAIDCFRSEELIDIIITDIDLGKGINGIEEAEILHQISDVPIVLYSSFLFQEISREENITDFSYLSKTAKRENLLKLIFELLTE